MTAGARRVPWGLVVTVAALFVPALGSRFYTFVATDVAILALFAVSLNLLLGYTGLVSFGHAAYFALGAYTCGLLLKKLAVPFVLAWPAGGLLAAGFALLFGFFCVRLTKIYFAMLTLAFAQLLYAVAYKWQSVTGGSDGLAGVPRTPGPFGLTWFTSRAGYYYLVAACLAASYALCRAFVASPVGATLLAIRDHERKAEALGYPTRAYKVVVFVVASFFGGLAGALYAPFAGFTSPELFFWTVSGQALIMVIVGGAGTLVGPMLGAAFFLLLEHHLSAVTDSWALGLGLIFVAVVILVPDGLWGLLRRRTSRRPAPGAVVVRPHGQPVP